MPCREGEPVAHLKHVINFISSHLKLILVSLILAYSSVLFAQSEQSIEVRTDKTFQIPRLEAEPVIDGILDEAVWSEAVLVEDLHQIKPVEHVPPSQHTEIRLFYTEDALYIGARMLDTQADKINAQVLNQGGAIFSDDYFGFSIDPYLDKRNGYSFMLNPNGVRWDALFKNITEFVGNWDGIWQGEGKIDEEGWTAEIRMPFQTLSFNPDTSTWGINFERWVARDHEWIGWVTRERQMNPAVSGTATGFHDLKQGRGLDIVPSFTVRQEKVYGATPGSEESYEPSLDIFYKITPQLNAALTINTDFSAAEVDSRQVNLTRFSLFFPEKRNFFLKDADIFDFGRFGSIDFFNGGNPAIPAAASQNARPFFSRQIGLSQFGEPVDIKYGGKLSGRIGNFNVGSLIIHQDNDSNTGVDAQDIFVGRATVNILAESFLGGIVTHGDPQSNLDSTLIGTDFNYRNSRLRNGRIIAAHAWYQQTDTEGLTGDNRAYGIGFGAPNADAWRGEFAFKRIEENFDPAVGFVNRSGIQDFALDFGYRHRDNSGGYLRSIYGGFDGYRAETLNDGKVSSQTIGLRLTGENNTGDNMSSRIIRSREVLQEDFNIYTASDGSQSVVIPRGDYSFNELLINIDFGGQRIFSGGGWVRGGEYYDGTHLSYNINASWKPNRHFQTSINYTQDDIDLPYGDFVVRLMSLNADIIFSSNWSWSNLVQYDNVSEILGFNSRLNWTPQAGRDVFIVFNYGMQDRDKNNHFESTSSNLSLKFNYTFRF